MSESVRQTAGLAVSIRNRTATNWRVPVPVAASSHRPTVGLKKRAYADCPTCGPVNEHSVDDSAVQLALAHSAATGHVVVLNGTTDLPETDAEHFGEGV